MKYLRVVWRDSGIQHSEGWEKLSTILAMTKISNVETVGVFAHETDDTLYIALSADYDHNNFFGVQGIYKPDIIIREELVPSHYVADDGPEAC